ncbi:MAG: plasmid mobilization protein [Cypionkella sp.]
MTKFFKNKDPATARSVRYPLMLTKEEAETIRHSANIRQLSVAEFVRRAALGRKADVDFETEIVVALNGLRRTIMELSGLHAAMVERGLQPPADDWRPVILEARAAIEQITN